MSFSLQSNHRYPPRFFLRKMVAPSHTMLTLGLGDVQAAMPCSKRPSKCTKRPTLGVTFSKASIPGTCENAVCVPMFGAVLKKLYIIYSLNIFTWFKFECIDILICSIHHNSVSIHILQLTIKLIWDRYFAPFKHPRSTKLSRST